MILRRRCRRSIYRAAAHGSECDGVPQNASRRDRPDRSAKGEARPKEARGSQGHELRCLCSCLSRCPQGQLAQREAPRPVRNTLSSYASPVFGSLPVQTIDVALVMKALEPIWKGKPETASRLRGRIETVLDWATVREYRKGENPARWRAHLDKLLPARPRSQRSSTILLCPMTNSRASCRPFGTRMGLRRGRWSS